LAQRLPAVALDLTLSMTSIAAAVDVEPAGEEAFGEIAAETIVGLR
jgi:hypothetical protein